MAVIKLRTLLLTAGSALAVTLAAPMSDAAKATDAIARQIFATDLSDSFLVAVHDRSAQAAGRIVARHVATLSPGD